MAMCTTLKLYKYLYTFVYSVIIGLLVISCEQYIQSLRFIFRQGKKTKYSKFKQEEHNIRGNKIDKVAIIIHSAKIAIKFKCLVILLYSDLANNTCSEYFLSAIVGFNSVCIVCSILIPFKLFICAVVVWNVTHPHRP